MGGGSKCPSAEISSFCAAAGAGVGPLIGWWVDEEAVVGPNIGLRGMGGSANDHHADTKMSESCYISQFLAQTQGRSARKINVTCCTPYNV